MSDPDDSSFLAPYLLPSENRGVGADQGEGAGQRPREVVGRERERERLFRDLYDELHRRAEGMMRGQPAGHTLQATALVHEVLLKMWGGTEPPWEDRARFLAAASKAMRHVLVDHARARARDKRQPPGDRVPLDSITTAYEARAGDLLALDEALDRLAAFDPTMARAVELRFFGGLSVEEAARLLEIPVRTLERRWSAVRAWLFAEVS
jgi:RNA polymerase sigma-70 factor (ECF subfamily)